MARAGCPHPIQIQRSYDIIADQQNMASADRIRDRRRLVEQTCRDVD